MNYPLPKSQWSVEAGDLEAYGRDWTRRFPPKASVVLFPESTTDVQAVVQWAQQNKQALVPSGGRTGLAGGAVASKGEAVVSFDRMNKILEWNPIDRWVRLQAGVVTQELQEAAVSHGLYFPVDFASRGSSQIGGNVATNAGGIHVIRYGMMRDWVLGLEVVTGTGEILKLQDNLVKNNFGLDLKHLFIGSEGCLGLITEVSLKLTHAPQDRHCILVALDDLRSAFSILESLRRTTTLHAFEFLDQACLEQVCAQHGLEKPFAEVARFLVVIDVDEKDLNRMIDLAEVWEAKKWIVSAAVAQNEKQIEEFWQYRELISESLASLKPYKNDVSVQVARVPEFLEAVDQVLTSQYPGVRSLYFGHLADGNVHINCVRGSSQSEQAFATQSSQLALDITEILNRFGGSPSAEHGIGLLKQDLMNASLQADRMKWMRGIKSIFDPQGLLNPGKSFSAL
jgi:FAD/FMN-containing dehydrogenase